MIESLLACFHISKMGIMGKLHLLVIRLNKKRSGACSVNVNQRCHSFIQQLLLMDLLCARRDDQARVGPCPHGADTLSWETDNKGLFPTQTASSGPRPELCSLPPSATPLDSGFSRSVLKEEGWERDGNISRPCGPSDGVEIYT